MNKYILGTVAKEHIKELQGMGVLPEYPPPHLLHTYTTSHCPKCGRETWIGEEGRKLVEDDLAIEQCSKCFEDHVRKHGGDGVQLVPLTDK